jgi:hypothetical protein
MRLDNKTTRQRASPGTMHERVLREYGDRQEAHFPFRTTGPARAPHSR